MTTCGIYLNFHAMNIRVMFQYIQISLFFISFITLYDIIQKDIDFRQYKREKDRHSLVNFFFFLFSNILYIVARLPRVLDVVKKRTTKFIFNWILCDDFCKFFYSHLMVQMSHSFYIHWISLRVQIFCHQHVRLPDSWCIFMLIYYIHVELSWMNEWENLNIHIQC